MKFIEVLKNKKFLLLNIFLTLYVGINLIGGERGLFSYIKKKNFETLLMQDSINLLGKVKIIENKNQLLSKKNDLDYLDILYRDKLKFGNKDEIIIKLK
jgi:cell division protein FtsB